MAAGRFQDFFGDDLDDALDSLRSVPGAFGNIMMATARQVRPVDAAAFALVIAGWLWLAIGFGLAGNHSVVLAVTAVVPTLLWLGCGAVAGLVFEISGLGKQSLAYWESYVLILLFAAFGLISLRLALNPSDRHVYRAPTTPHDL